MADPAVANPAIGPEKTSRRQPHNRDKFWRKSPKTNKPPTKPKAKENCNHHRWTRTGSVTLHPIIKNNQGRGGTHPYHGN
jgi:hypothetical protein